MKFSKPLITVLLIIFLFTGGLIFLLRGCLSKFDERFAMPGLMYFEKEGKSLVFSIVQFQKTTSYSKKGGSVRKSVNVSYYIQSNDAISGKKINSKKIKTQKQIKTHPVQTLGAAGNVAWIFAGELMAFDPFTLEKMEDAASLQEKNPALKGKLPLESRFYEFNSSDQQIYFTATDGSKWQLNPQTRIAVLSNYDPEISPVKREISRLDAEFKSIDAEIDSAYQQLSRRPSTEYSSGQISRDEYGIKQKQYHEKSSELKKLQDSIRRQKDNVQRQERSLEERQRTKQNLQRGGSFSQIKVNQDTFSGKWFGLYTNNEFIKLNDRFSFTGQYDETARRHLMISDYSLSVNGDAKILKVGNSSFIESQFLDGGFLLDKQTTLPVRLNDPDGYLIVHKDQIGNEGKIQVTRINSDAGISVWSFSSELKEWNDWILAGDRLIILGTSHKDLSTNECNLLWCLDLSTGKAGSYDYFKDKPR